MSYLDVGTLDAAPESVEACLAVAAGRLSGRLIFQNRVSGGNAGGDGEEGNGERGAFEVPCLENATTVSLDLGFLVLAVPPAGVFARLTELSLWRVRFHGPCDLGAVVSSTRCPCLQKLSARNSRELSNLAIHSESLLEVDLQHLVRLLQLTLVAPALKKLTLCNCFAHRRPVANISTTHVVLLEWLDAYDPTSVQLGNLAQLQLLTGLFFVYDSHDSWYNLGFMRLLEQFQDIRSLKIKLLYHQVPYVCPSGCVYDQPTDWKTEELTLKHLQEVAIDMEGTDHQVAFVKQLLTWAVVLKKMEITFDPLISESKVQELHWTLSSFSRPETHMEFYMYHSAGRKSGRKLCLLAPQDQSTDGSRL